MATKVPSTEDLQAAMNKIEAIYSEFQMELARIKIERNKIIDRVNKKADDKKIQEILKKIK